jgi:hypothetical protein
MILPDATSMMSPFSFATWLRIRSGRILPSSGARESFGLLDKRDANGLFTKGTKPGPGRPPGSPNKIPKSIKEVMRALSEGAIEVGYPEPLTGQPTTGPVAHLLAEKIVEGLNLPAKDAHAYVKTMLEYSIGRPKTMEQGTGEDLKQIPRMIFLPRARSRLWAPLASGRSWRALCPGACRRRLPWLLQGLLRGAPFCRASFWRAGQWAPYAWMEAIP